MFDRMIRRVRRIPDHHFIANRLVCLNESGPAMEVAFSHRWTFCPACGGHIASNSRPGLPWQKRIAWNAMLSTTSFLAAIVLGGIVTVEVAEYAANNVGDEALAAMLQVDAFGWGYVFGLCHGENQGDENATYDCIDNTTADFRAEWINLTNYSDPSPGWFS